MSIEFCQIIEVSKSSQKFKFWLKIEILFKNRNFVQQSKISSKIEIFLKNLNFVQTSKFHKNRNLAQKSKFCSKIEILLKHRNFEKISDAFFKKKLYEPLILQDWKVANHNIGNLRKCNK